MTPLFAPIRWFARSFCSARRQSTLKAKWPRRSLQLDLDTLEDRLAPASPEPSFRGGISVAAGDVNGDGITDMIGAPASGGTPTVVVYSGVDGSPISSFLAFEPTFTGGMFLAVDDVLGDVRPEVIIGAGVGGGPRVLVVDPLTGTTLKSFFAYDPGVRGGVHVAAGDIDNDGVAEIITGTGVGGGPHVRIFDAKGTNLNRDFLAYDGSFRGGVSVAVGDFNGDGLDDIATTPGDGGGPHVKIFDSQTGQLFTSFFVNDVGSRGGAWVGVGDVDGNGLADVVIGTGSGVSTKVHVFAGQGIEFASWSVYEPSFTGGVRIAVSDLDGDAFADVITGPGIGGGPRITIWDGYSFNREQDFFAVTDGRPLGFGLGSPPERTPLYQGVTFIAPGFPGAESSLISDVLRRFDQLGGEIGVFRVDSATGRIGNLLPGDFGYNVAALASDRRIALFDPSVGPGIAASLKLEAGTRYGFYLIRGGSYLDWQSSGFVDTPALGAVFPFPAANPDGADLFRVGPRNRAVFESRAGGDNDFNDLIVDVRISTEVSLVPGLQPPTVAASPLPTSPPTPPSLNQADLSITASGLMTTYVPGQVVADTLVVRNDGPSNVIGALVTTVRSPGILTGQSWKAIYSSGGSGPSEGKGELAATVSLTVGATATFILSASSISSATGVLQSSTSISIPLGLTDPNFSNNTLNMFRTASPQSDVSVISSISRETYIPGLDVSYSFTAANNGPSDVIGATLVHQLPASLAGASWKAVYSAGASGPASGFGNLTIPLNLPYGSKVIFNITSPTSPGTTDNLESAASILLPAEVHDPFVANNSSVSILRAILEADLQVTITDNQTEYTPGDIITYTVIARNNGPSNVTQASISTTLSPAISASTWSATFSTGASGSTQGSGSLLTNVNLTSGASVTFTLVGAVSANVTGELVNSVTIIPPSGALDLITGNNMATDRTAPRLVPPNFPLNLAGWTVAEQGGSASKRGTVSAPNGSAVIQEGDSFIVSFSKSFVIPSSSMPLSFTYSDLAFDRSSPGFINDAFEVALLDDKGNPLVAPFLPDRDTFFNLTDGEGLVVSTYAKVQDRTVSVDLSGIAPGTSATLVFRLVNNDSDRSSQITLRQVMLPTELPGPAPVKFFVVDEKAERTFKYGEEGIRAGIFSMSAVTAARGVASNTAGDRVWVIDNKSKQVSVYQSNGVSLGAWATLDTSDPQGVTVDNGTLWIVDRGSRTVLRYDGGAIRTSGFSSASTSFALHPANSAPSDIVTNGASIWVTDDTLAEVFVYDLSGLLLGRWNLDNDNLNPSGVTLNPIGGAELWVLDRNTRSVYLYNEGMHFRSGRQSANSTFLLASENTQPEGIADPPILNLTDPVAQAPVGTSVLFTGRATPDSTGSAVAAVTINGQQVEAIDASGAFFTRELIVTGENKFEVTATAVDGTSNTTSVVVHGRQSDRVSPNDLTDLTTTFRAEYGRTSYRHDGRELSVEVAVRNIGSFPVVGPIFIGVRNLSEPTTQVLNADGVMADGTAYFDLSEHFSGVLASGNVSLPHNITFSNPSRGRFTYDLVVYGQSNRSPIFSSVPEVEATVSQKYRYSATATDPDSDQLSFSLVAGPSNLLVSPSGIVTWIPSAADIGNHAVILRVEDGRGGSAEQSFNLTSGMAHPNRPPVFRSKPVVEAQLGVPYQYSALADDPDLDPVAYSLGAGSQLGMMINSETGAVTWTPLSGSLGDQEVTILVSDGRGGVAEQTFTICVGNNGNRPPVIVSEPIRAIPSLSSGIYNYDVDALDPENDPLTYSLLQSPDGMTINSKTGLIQWDASKTGSTFTNRTSWQTAAGGVQTVKVLHFDGPSEQSGYTVVDTRISPSYESQGVRFLPFRGTNVYPVILRNQGYQIPDPTRDGLVINNVSPNPTSDLIGRAIRLEFLIPVFAVGVHTNLNDGGYLQAYDAASMPIGRVDLNSGEFGGITTALPIAYVEIVNTYNADMNFGIWDLQFSSMPTDSTVVVRVDDGRGMNDEQRFSITTIPSTVSGYVWNDLNGNGIRDTAPIVYDAAQQFSTVSNPNGVWTYGYRQPGAPTTTFISYTQLFYDFDGVDIWGAGLTNNGIPFVAHTNTGQTVQPDNPPTPLFRPGELSLHPGPTDQNTIVRFTTPVAGQYDISARFTPSDVSHGTTDTHVLINGVTVFDGVASLTKTANFTVSSVFLKAGDVIDFAVGYGGNGFSFDTTGLEAKVSRSIFIEPGLEGQRVFLDSNRNGRFDASEPTAISDISGEYRLLGVPPGVNHAVLLSQSGWEQTFPLAASGQDFVTDEGALVTGINFGTSKNPAWDGRNRPPEFEPISSPISATVRELLRVNLRVSDSDEDSLTFDLLSGPTGMVIDPNRGVAVWYPFADQVGTHDVVVRATDGGGLADYQSLTVVVTSPNTPPVITSLSPAGPATVGLQYQYLVTTQDAEQSSLVFSLRDPQLGMAIDAVSGLFTWTPTVNQVGSTTLTVVATDGFGSVEQSFQLDVSPTPNNRSPLLQLSARSKTWLGRPYLAWVSGSDPDGDPVRFELTAGPTGMTIDSVTGEIRWLPSVVTKSPVGVAVRATDGRGGFDTANFSVEVSATDSNHSPVIRSSPSLTAIVGQLYSYDLSASDKDGDRVTWQLLEKPAGVSLNNASGTLRWTPSVDQIGEVTLVARAFDGLLAFDEQIITITVACEDQPPSIVSRPPTLASVDSTYLYAVRAADPEGQPLLFTVESGPVGMSFAPGTSLIRWTPTPVQTGSQSVVVSVTDPAGNTAKQTFTITAGTDTPNRSPLLNSRPVLGATLGRQYVYPIIANDPDGDLLTFTLSDAPLGMTIDNSGIINWLPTNTETHQVTVSVTDGRGGIAVQSYTIRARPNQAPIISPIVNGEAALATLFQTAVRATDPEQDPLRFALEIAPSGMSIDSNGIISWLVSGPARSEPVQVRVTDPDGLFSTSTFTLRVVTDSEAPTVRLLLSKTATSTNSAISVEVLATDNVAISTLTLTANGVPLALDSANRATFFTTQPGRFAFTAIASDPSGNLGAATAELSVSQGGVVTADPNSSPTVTAIISRFDQLTQPGIGSSIDPRQERANLSYLTEVIGTADAGTTPLAFWKVLYARSDRVDFDRPNPDDPAWTTIGSGSTPVINGRLATFDPTLLANDRYAIAVVAFDILGRGYISIVEADLVGTAKLGAFELEFTDLTVALSGIPIEVTRVYSTLEAKTEGDFGFGWRLGIRDAQIRETEAQQGDGFFTTGAAFRAGSKVYLTNPRGQRIGFTFRPITPAEVSPGVPNLFGVSFPRFEPDPGVTDRLDVDQIAIQQASDGRLYWFLFRIGYNPDTYRLTTVDGMTYTYNQFSGLQTIADLNGNVVTFGPNEIRHSNGQTVTMERDGQGRIVALRRPDGQVVVRYTYDAAGDLTAVKQVLEVNPFETTLDTTFVYRTDLPHYLDSYTDPEGRRAVKTEYDTNGRLLAVTDANGNRVQQEFDLAQFTESQTDARGNVTRLVYNDRGNVVRVIDPLGGVTLREYSDLLNPDLETKITDPRGVVVARTYDARGNLLTFTDSDGTTSFTYDTRNKVQTVTDPLARLTSFGYDDNGNLIRVIDPDGNTQTFTFTTSGQIASRSDQLGRVTRFEYTTSTVPSRVVNPDGTEFRSVFDSIGNLVSITNEMNRSTTFSYDSANRLIARTEVDGATTRFTYDGNGKILTETDPLGRVNRYQYDLAGQKTRSIDALGNATAQEFDANGNVIRITNALGQATIYEFDALNRLIKVTDPLGQITLYGYDEVGNRTSITDPNGITSTYQFDGLNRLVSWKDSPTATARTNEYDKVGRLIRTIDGNGGIIRNVYDRLDRLISVTDTLGSVNTYGYDATNNMTVSTDTRGNLTRYAYDSRNRLVSVIDPTGAVTHFTYDGVGNRLSATDANGKITRYEYDLRDRLAKVIDPLGNTTSYSYDLVGNQTSTIDPIGRVTSSTFDALNRTIRSKAADGTTTDFGFDALSRPLSLTDPLGNITRYEYDSANRLIREIDPLGLATNYSYDSTGNRTEVIDRNGRRRTFGFDDRNRMTSEVWWEGGVSVNTINYSYDQNSNLTTVSDTHSSYTYTYDALNRLQTEDNAGTPNVPRIAFTYSYDSEGNTISVLDNMGVRVDSIYDTRNLLTGRTWSGTGVAAQVQMGYDPIGRLTSVSRFANTTGTTLAGTSSVAYDDAGRRLTMRHLSATASPIAEYSFTFDPASQLTNFARNSKSVTVGYDATGQVLSADYSAQSDEMFAYDDNGNRSATGVIIGPGNRLIEDPATSYNHDNEGNLIRKVDKATGNITNYTWDHRNRLVRVVESTASGITIRTVQFEYDLYDRRIAKVVDGVRTTTRYLGQNAWADADASGTVTARYLFGEGPDTILARQTTATGLGWYLADHLGTIRDVTNAAGEVVNHLEYSAFGTILSQTNPAAGDRFAFTGREYDSETGLYYYRARYYSPETGRFISEDPIRFSAGDTNLFRYVGNRPTVATDPSGMLSMLEYAGAGSLGAGINRASGAIVGFLQEFGFVNLQFISAVLDGTSSGFVNDTLASEVKVELFEYAFRQVIKYIAERQIVLATLIAVGEVRYQNQLAFYDGYGTGGMLGKSVALARIYSLFVRSD